MRLSRVVPLLAAFGLIAGLVQVPLVVSPAGAVACGGVVWQDDSADGVRATAGIAAEGGIANVAVAATDAAGTIVASATSDADGAFTLDLPANTPVRVQATIPGGYSEAPLGPGNASSVQFLDDCSSPILIGLVFPPDCTSTQNHLGNRIWNDTDGDGIQDAGEPGIGGVQLGLYQNAVLITTTETGPDGSYQFGPANVPGGLIPTQTYEVRLDRADDLTAGPLAGLNLTVLATGADLTIDSDFADFAGVPTATVTVGAASTTDHSVDAGFAPDAFIAGTVYVDAAADGSSQLDPADATSGPDSGLGQVTVTLIGAGPDGAFGTADDTTTTTTTGPDGSYDFAGLAPGDYRVEVDPVTVGTALPGATSTFDPDGTLDDETTLTLAAGTPETGTDFGYSAPANLGIAMDLVRADDSSALPTVTFAAPEPYNGWSTAPAEQIVRRPSIDDRWVITVANTGGVDIDGPVDVEANLPIYGTTADLTVDAPGWTCTFAELFTVVGIQSEATPAYEVPGVYGHSVPNVRMTCAHPGPAPASSPLPVIAVTQDQEPTLRPPQCIGAGQIAQLQTNRFGIHCDHTPYSSIATNFEAALRVHFAANDPGVDIDTLVEQIMVGHLTAPSAFSARANGHPLRSDPRFRSAQATVSANRAETTTIDNSTDLLTTYRLADIEIAKEIVAVNGSTTLPDGDGDGFVDTNLGDQVDFRITVSNNDPSGASWYGFVNVLDGLDVSGAGINNVDGMPAFSIVDEQGATWTCVDEDLALLDILQCSVDEEHELATGDSISFTIRMTFDSDRYLSDAQTLTAGELENEANVTPDLAATIRCVEPLAPFIFGLQCAAAGNYTRDVGTDFADAALREWQNVLANRAEVGFEMRLPDLTYTKTLLGTPIAQRGEVLTSEVTISNVGGGDYLDTITFTDMLSPHLDFVSGSGPGWTCVVNPGVFTPTGYSIDALSCTNESDIAALGTAPPLTIVQQVRQTWSGNTTAEPLCNSGFVNAGRGYVRLFGTSDGVYQDLDSGFEDITDDPVNNTARGGAQDPFSQAQGWGWCLVAGAASATPIDLEIAKTTTATTVVPGDPVTYTILVTNNGTNAVTPEVVERVGANTTLTAETATGAGWAAADNGDGTWTFVAPAPLAPATSTSFDVTLTTTAATSSPFQNQVEVHAVDPGVRETDFTNNFDDALVYLANPDLVLAKSDGDPDPAVAGQAVTWTIDVSNAAALPNGDATIAATGVTVTDALPADFTYDDAATDIANGAAWTCNLVAGEVVCTLGDPSLDPGEVATPLLLVTTVDAGWDTSAAFFGRAVFTNTASIAADQPDPPDNNTDTGEVQVRILDAALTKSMTGPALRGATSTVTLTVGNRSPGLAVLPTFAPANLPYPLTVADTLPAGLSFVPDPGNYGSNPAVGTWDCTAGGQVVTCVLVDPDPTDASTLIPFAEVIPPISFDVAIDADFGAPTYDGVGIVDAVNTAELAIGSDTPGTVLLETNDANNTASYPLTIGPDVADLRLTKVSTDADGLAAAGEVVGWTVTVDNVGPSAAHGPITVVDLLPPTLGPVSAIGTGWTCTFDPPLATGASPVTCVIGTAGDRFDVGALPPISLTSLIQPGARGDLRNQATVFPGGSAESISDARAGVLSGDPGVETNVASANVIVDTCCLGNLVWSDLDGDGVVDPGEPGIGGVVVTAVWAGGDGVFGTADDRSFFTSTDVGGNYSFEGMPPGLYQVASATPPGTLPTYDLDSGTGAAGEGVTELVMTDSSGVYNHPTRGALTPGPVPADGISTGQTRHDVDFGFDWTGSMGDLVWADADADGIQDPNEIGIRGATVVVTWAGPDGVSGTADDVVMAPVTTDAGGMWVVDGLPPGNYGVSVVPPPEFTGLSPANAGGDDAVDSDFVDNGSGYVFDGIVVLPVDDGDPATITDPTVDAGFTSELGSIGDTIWFDTDEDGIQDPGEPGAPGVVVVLYDATGRELARTTTDADGRYGFENLSPGTYTVGVELPAGYDPSPLGAGGDVALDSDVNATGRTGPVVLAPGEDRTDVDAGLVEQPARLGQTVWEDTDRDGVRDPDESGIAGATVTVTTPDGTVVVTVATDSNGYYDVPDLAAGTYVVTVTPPTGYTATTPLTYTVELSPGETDLSANFGFVRPLPITGASTGDLLATALGLVAVGFVLTRTGRKRTEI